MIKLDCVDIDVSPQTSTTFPSSNFRQVNPCLDRIKDPPSAPSDLTLIILSVNGSASYIFGGVDLFTLQILGTVNIRTYFGRLTHRQETFPFTSDVLMSLLFDHFVWLWVFVELLVKYCKIKFHI